MYRTHYQRMRYQQSPASATLSSSSTYIPRPFDVSKLLEFYHLNSSASEYFVSNTKTNTCFHHEANTLTMMVKLKKKNNVTTLWEYLNEWMVTYVKDGVAPPVKLKEGLMLGSNLGVAGGAEKLKPPCALPPTTGACCNNQYQSEQ